MDFHKRTGTGFLFAPTGAALVLCALMSAMSAVAETTWDGGGANANWRTANIWNTNGLPLFNGTEQITIGTGFASGTTMTLAGNRSNNDLSINATTGFTIAAGTGGTLNLRSANIILGAESGSLTFGGGTLQVTQDVTSLLAIKINTAGAGHTALFNVGVGKILQDASVRGKNGDPLLFNSGTSILSGSGSNETDSTTLNGILSLPETVTLGPGNFAFAGGILELGNSNFTRAFGAGVRQVNMNSASSGADFAAFGADRVANLGSGGATVTWGAGNDALSSGPITGAGTGISTSSTYAIQSDIRSPLLAGPGSTMTKTPGGPDAVTAIKTWNGGSGIDSNWSRSNNWGGTGAPAAGDSLFFVGSTRLTPNNDLTAGTSFAGITFNAGAGAFTLGGNRITLGGNVNNNSAATETINNAITLGIAQTWSATSGNLVFGGTIANGGFLLTIGGNSNTTVSGIISGTGGLTKTGTGTLTFSGAAANTFTGTTTVNGGTLVLARPAGQNSIVGALVIGDGVGVDTFRIDVGDQFGLGLITINSSGVFQLNNVSEIIAALTMNGGAVTTGTGTLTLGGTVTGNAAATSATISGKLALSEFAGTTRTFTIADGAAAVDMDISAVVSGADDLTKGGAGTMVLSGANTYTGLTTVSAGVLNIQNNTGLGTTAAGTIVSSGATLQLQGGITVGVAETLNINGTGAGGQTGALVNVSGTNNYGGLLTLAGATTLSSDSGTLNLTNAGTITGATFGLTLGGAGNGSISSIIGTTSGSLTKSGTGTWTLLGANTFTGVTTITAGVLNVQNATGLGTTAGGTTVSNGATMQLQGGITVGSEALNISGTGAGGQTGALVNVSGTNNYGGLLTLAGDTTLSSDSGTLNLTNVGTILGATFGLTLNGAGNGSISSIIGITSGSLTKNGTGTWILSGANTYTGATNINAGTLREGTANVIFDTSAVTVATGATYDLNSFSETIGSLAGGGTVTSGVAGALTLTAGADNTSTLFSGLLQDGSGAIAFTKSGTGTLTFSGANTYTGVTTVSAGVLNIQNNTGLGTTAGGTTVSNGATLQFQNNVTIGNEALNIRGTGAGGQTGALVNVSGTNNYGGLLTLAGATTLSSDSGTLNLTNTNTITGATFGLTLAGAGNGSIASVIGTTSGSLTKNGTGTWTLSGANTFTGATTVNGGTLVLASGSGSALGNTSGVTVNSGGTLFLGANNQINNTAAITLNGGTFARGDFSEGGINAAGVGALNLTAAGSHLDFGTGTVGVLTFASFAPGANTLTIDNWTGTFSTQGTGLTDRLIFASDQSGNLGSFNFTGFGPGAVEFNLGNGYFEVVPVPEAGTYFSGSIVLALILLHHRKQLRQLVHRWRVSRKLRFSGAHGTGVAS